MNKTQKLLQERSELFNKEFSLYSNYADFCPDIKEYKDFHTTTLSLVLNSLEAEIGARKIPDVSNGGLQIGDASAYNQALSDISTLLSEIRSNLTK